MKKIKIAFIIIITICFSIFIIYIIYNHLWRIEGFKNCVNPNNYTVLKYDITDNEFSMIVEKGDMYNTKILGYLYEYENNILKIGIKYYSGYIALFDKSYAFDKITIPLISSDINEVILSGEGININIDERYNEEEYLSIKEYIDKIDF